mmetsp:Transcript_36440/g.89762  ORF Transcript_36440/g.89762 Transcript_36440/m.89762 type:complete len:310 (+) Transcript_36440:28-957(+)
MFLRSLLVVALGAAGASAFSTTSVLPSRGVSQPLCTREARSSRPNGVLGTQAALTALLFDCDGVLADTERDGHRIAFNKAFEENNLKIGDQPMVWDEELYGKLVEIGGGKERMVGYWEQIGWDEGSWDLAVELHKRKTQIFQDMISAGEIPLRTGVLRLVDEAIKEKIKIAVCSTSNEKAVAEIVKMMGPERASKIEIFAGDIVERKKPFPDVYELAANTLRVKPEDCLVIEDSRIGLMAAKAAKMSCIVTKSTYTKNEDFKDAELVVDDLDSGNVDITTVGGLTQSTSWEDWGIDKDIQNANVGRGRW